MKTSYFFAAFFLVVFFAAFFFVAISIVSYPRYLDEHRPGLRGSRSGGITKSRPNIEGDPVLSREIDGYEVAVTTFGDCTPAFLNIVSRPGLSMAFT